MKNEIKAVIFDCFGVLTTDGWLPFKQKYFGHDPKLTQQASDLNKKVDAGIYSYADFIHQAAQLTGISDDDARRQIENNVADETLFAYIRDNIKPLYKVGMLSNAGDNWLDELFTPWQVALFDETVLSYQIGITKPSIEAYEIIATKLGMLPEECLFIDDQPRYVTGSVESGMVGLHFSTTDKFIRDFEAIGK